jgi:hypothetical protein
MLTYSAQGAKLASRVNIVAVHNFTAISGPGLCQTSRRFLILERLRKGKKPPTVNDVNGSASTLYHRRTRTHPIHDPGTQAERVVADIVSQGHPIVAVNVVPKRSLFAGRAIYDCGPLQPVGKLMSRDWSRPFEAFL